MKGNLAGEGVSVLLIYPDSLKTALGSPGFKQIFRTLSQARDCVVDWGWYDDRNNHIVYESRNWKKEYDFIGFSVPYELNYESVVRSLEMLNVEPERKMRKPYQPLVVLGGAAPTINPSVAGAIADVIFIGEAEQYIVETLQNSKIAKKTGAAPQLTPMLGIPIPKENGAAPRFIYPQESIDSSFFSHFDNPTYSTFRGAGLIEVGRGCSRRCRFCAAGHIYLPVRHRSVDSILRDVESYRGKAERIGLVGASISDHYALKEVIREILDRGFGLTTSSFRADMLDDDLALLLKKGGLKTVTIAPEGGSERIRKIMNKHLTEEEILHAVRSCTRAGIKNLRIYYMIGLPWEKESDIDAILELTGKIKSEFSLPGSTVTVSINPFIPKPQTPFQWCGMAEPSYLERIYKKIKKDFLHRSGIVLKTLSIRIALKEAVISLGDEAVGKAIIEHIRDTIAWKKALALNHVDVHTLVHTTKAPDEPFPWDHVTGNKIKAALFTSFEKAQCAALEL
ncbi:MAG TPA: radical SAM protein [Anaerolineae bacterium]|nr:radical SAM protein [Anaerolineae bacterium]